MKSVQSLASADADSLSVQPIIIKTPVLMTRIVAGLEQGV
jgi:hypothetical protein